MQTALVTGASRGVGRGIAVSLAESGYRVFATGRTVATASLPDSIVRKGLRETRGYWDLMATSQLMRAAIGDR